MTEQELYDFEAGIGGRQAYDERQAERDERQAERDEWLDHTAALFIPGTPDAYTLAYRAMEAQEAAS